MNVGVKKKDLIVIILSLDIVVGLSKEELIYGDIMIGDFITDSQIQYEEVLILGVSVPIVL
jgi:hypothetical protein